MSPLDLVFHHVGIATTSLSEEEVYYTTLGYRREGDVFTDPSQKIKGLFMTLGSMRIELLEALSKDSPVNGFLKRGMKMYHQAFLCGDIEKTVAFLVEQGAFVAVKPIPAVAFGGRRICFLMIGNKTLVELIEKP